MSDDRKNHLVNRTLILNMDQQYQEKLIRVAKALNSPSRLRILDYLQARVANISEIAEALDLPRPTANLHLNILAEAGLIRFETMAARRGVQKICTRIYDIVVMHLPRNQYDPVPQSVTIEMPVGAYLDHQIAPTCGLASQIDLIGRLDDLASFYEPGRMTAQLIWFGQGYLEYRFPNRADFEQAPHNLQLSMEICSEAAPHHLDWPSDIFLEINGVFIGTWTSPGDFGGERGKLTPEWWGEWNSQYGLLKTWRVDQEGSFIDGRSISDVVIADLKLEQQPFIQIRIGVKPDAANVGGLNIFGREFGNHPQDIVLKLNY